MAAHARRPSSAAARGVAGGVPSLQRLCERLVATHLVEPRTVLAVLEFADAAGAELLRQHCIAVRSAAALCGSNDQSCAPAGQSEAGAELLPSLQPAQQRSSVQEPGRGNGQIADGHHVTPFAV